eukprot:CAMPEP_0117654622 /NCGR_PEP_ID=MMETSP0804-20121206/3841_1 /TAXON_ID=1074897 /ORGANISM="Tetraselmis astigmatica, Strain CCMP880" /LENGTH=106 /DNA_ID=CAMNT_0005460913 /DNA_START=106 /DNA_END=427 /DNA_ORIENTATION=-
MWIPASAQAPGWDAASRRTQPEPPQGHAIFVDGEEDLPRPVDKRHARGVRQIDEEPVQRHAFAWDRGTADTPKKRLSAVMQVVLPRSLTVVAVQLAEAARFVIGIA